LRVRRDSKGFVDYPALRLERRAQYLRPVLVSSSKRNISLFRGVISANLIKPRNTPAMILADTTTQLPFWFPLSNAALTLIVAAATAFFAYRQHQLGNTEVRIALFERRIAVYDSMKRFLANIMITGTTKTDDLVAMLRDTKHAQFLFEPGDDINGYIKEFYSKGVDLEIFQKENPAIWSLPSEEQRQHLVKQESDMRRWFQEQTNVVDEKFRKYLKV
jgi:hypothetical protein